MQNRAAIPCLRRIYARNERIKGCNDSISIYNFRFKWFFCESRFFHRISEIKPQMRTPRIGVGNNIANSNIPRHTKLVFADNGWETVVHLQKSKPFEMLSMAQMVLVSMPRPTTNARRERKNIYFEWNACDLRSTRFQLLQLWFLKRPQIWLTIIQRAAHINCDANGPGH